MTRDDDSSQLVITGIEAAVRQMSTAIDLYFADADAVSIHTLAAASYDIILNLTKKAGRRLNVKDAMLDLIRPELRERLGKSINAPQNFFKHAGQMPTKRITFSPFLTEMLLVDAGYGYQQLASQLPEKLAMMRAWFFITHPDAVPVDYRNANLSALSQTLCGVSRDVFLAGWRLNSKNIMAAVHTAPGTKT